MANAQGSSLGSAISKWLDDSSEAAELAVLRMERLRSMPRESLLALMEASIPAVDVAGDRQGAAEGRKLLAELRRNGAAVAATGDGAPGAPSSNTGLKVVPKTIKTHREGSKKGGSK